MVGVSSAVVEQLEETELLTPCDDHLCGRLKNSEFLSVLDDQLSYLSGPQQREINGLIQSYPSILSDVPGQTSLLRYDADMGNASPIKQHAYRCSPAKREHKSRSRVPG